MSLVEIIFNLLIALISASGFWQLWLARSYKKKTNDEFEFKNKTLLVGLAHDRIIHLGRKFIKRGYITVAEYENLHDYLYKPYFEAGGNGTAKKIIEEVNKLKMVDSHNYIGDDIEKGGDF